MKTALITLHATRPHYSKQVLDAMDHQCAGLHHIAGIEDIAGKKEEIYSIIESKIALYESISYVMNTGIHHTNNNLIGVFREFLESDCDSFIYLEDDTLPSNGARGFMDAQLLLHKENPKFANVGLVAWKDGEKPTEESLAEADVCHGDSSLWGFAGTRWAAEILALSTPIIANDGMLEKVKADHSFVFDYQFSKWRRDNGMYSVIPKVNRVQNIGEVGGVHRGGHTFETWEGL